jgi:hypothetical protein
LTAALKEHKEESKWTKAVRLAKVIGAFIGVIGALAAAAVFLFPTRDGRDQAARDNSTSSAEKTQNPTSAPNTPGAGASNERHLAELSLAQGGGAVRVIGAKDLSMPCGSGQSDDRYRQIEYELPGPYTSFTTRATAGGKADVEASVGVEVFVRARQERSDRTLKVGTIVLQANRSEPLTADITDARAILLRITCSASTLNVTFTDPRIGR